MESIKTVIIRFKNEIELQNSIKISDLYWGPLNPADPGSDEFHQIEQYIESIQNKYKDLKEKDEKPLIDSLYYLDQKLDFFLCFYEIMKKI